jgi:thymidylate kinase
VATRFVAVEGAIGVGKSTVTGHLCSAWEAASFHLPPEFRRFRAEVCLDERVPPVPRLAYYLGACLELSGLVERELARRDVVCDRYLASPLSLVELLGGRDREEIHRLGRPFWVTAIRPHLTLLLTARHDVARERMNRRGRARDDDQAHRLAMASERFYLEWTENVRRYAQDMGPVQELDTTDLGEDEMCREALRLVEGSLPQPA